MTIQRAFFSWSTSGLDWDRAPYETCSPNLRALNSYLTQRWGGEHLGCHGDRPIRQGIAPSAHSYGAATDWRYPTRAIAVSEVLPFLINQSAELGIDAIHDYLGDRIWRAGRTTSNNPDDWWRKQNGQGAGMGESWATYLHIETHFDSFNDGTPIADRLIPAAPEPPPEEDDMPLTDEDVDRIAQRTARYVGGAEGFRLSDSKNLSGVIEAIKADLDGTKRRIAKLFNHFGLKL